MKLRERKIMAPEPPRMSREQARRVRKLIRALCANCDGTNCLLLDDGETCPCPQLFTSSLICKYFRAAVLPEDQELQTALLYRRDAKRCESCGALFVPASNRGKYCPLCAVIEKRKRTRERVRRHRSSV